MANKIRCAVIGIGRLGYWHCVNIVTRIRNAELVSICDHDLTYVEKVAKELGISHYTNDSNEVIENENIDAVVIATTTESHYELLLKASTHKKYIFVEKPLVIDMGQALEIQKVFKENKTFCQVGFMRRFDPAYDEAKKRIEEGDIGKPLYYKAIARDPVAPHASFVKTSGGIFVDVSIHDFDLARYMMNSEITAVASHGRILKNFYMKEFNDVDQGLTYIEFSSGASGDIEVSRNAYYGYDIRAEVMGTEGTIFIGNLKKNHISILNKEGKTHDIVPDFPDRFADAYYLEMLDFFQAIKEKRTPRVTVEDGVVALEIALAAKKSFDTNKKVTI